MGSVCASQGAACALVLSNVGAAYGTGTAAPAAAPEAAELRVVAANLRREIELQRQVEQHRGERRQRAQRRLERRHLPADRGRVRRPARPVHRVEVGGGDGARVEVSRELNDGVTRNVDGAA